MSLIVDDFVAPECNAHIEILFRDDHILVINKPSGLLSLSGKNPLNQDSVHYRLVQDFPSALMAHRLDFGTSGIMLLALNKSANAELTKQFQMQRVTKTYISILEGHLLDDSGQIDAAIAKDPNLFPRVKICQQYGKPARSDYQVIERCDDPHSTRVRFFPHTGRTHQLRLHSQFMGHPILGCDLYGSSTSHLAAKRLMLHAETLNFYHPFSGQPMMMSCPCPF